MPKKERVYVEPPEREIPVETEIPRPKPRRARTPVASQTPSSPAEVPSPVASLRVEVSPVCPKCGLPRSDFAATFGKLRPSLQVSNGRVRCPRCFGAVQNY